MACARRCAPLILINLMIRSYLPNNNILEIVLIFVFIEPYKNPQDLSKIKVEYAFCLEFQEKDRSCIEKLPF